MPTPLTPEDRRLMLRQKVHMRDHLDELQALVGRPVRAEELESLERTKVLGEVARKQFSPLEKLTVEIPFSDRLSERFRDFVHRLRASNPSPVYVWIERANECGALLLPTITSVRFDFDFSIESNGIISISTHDQSDRLVLDFYVSDDGDKRMTVSTQGNAWGKIKY